MNSAKDVVRRLRVVLPRCEDCRVHRVKDEGMTCPYCQRLRDNIRRLEDERAAYIALHGEAAWDIKARRELEELF